MSELFMECVEEDLEPWQKPVPEVHVIEDDDDEPIFVGVVSNKQKDSKSNPVPNIIAGNSNIKRSAPQAAVGPTPIVLPLNIAGNAVNAAPPTLTTVTPQPVIVNNQGFIVTSPQIVNNSEFIASLGTQYPPGTSFTIVQAGQGQIFQQVPSGAVVPSAVHRPQVQQISNNVVTLSNVQSPTVYTTPAIQLQLNKPNSHSLQTLSEPVVNNPIKDESLAKRGLTLNETDYAGKRPKLNMTSPKVTVRLENGLVTTKCNNCQEELYSDEALKYHAMSCSVRTKSPSLLNTNKRIMLVSEFYYGSFMGEAHKRNAQKTNNTFKCQSCLKILKNNIRYMNHMKHHLELEKQNSESWESHTTCQHCYRQYMTPFQLQCHIESAHSPIESTTNCKICELAFESEQVLLEHMKGNHKPGEMPYVCQVCNYRSSFFSDVETHFRTVHDNTKDLMCPFCLKVLRSPHIYMQHYMKHQNKSIHRCGKCRLNFLTNKEKMEHRTHVHKTFRKPKALEGLSPGTKITIRASLTGKGPTSPATADKYAHVISTDPPAVNNLSIRASNQKFNLYVPAKTKTTLTKKENNRKSEINAALRTLSVDGKRYTCIECCSPIDDFFTHFPIISNCGACHYRTGCKNSIGNHMIRFHNTLTKNRPFKTNHKKPPTTLKLTLVCLNCDFLVDGTAGDRMTKHLADRPNHSCKVIQDRDIKAKEKVPPLVFQLTNVQVLPVTSQAAQSLKFTSEKQVLSVASAAETADTVEPLESEPMPSAAQQETAPSEFSVMKGSPEEDLPQPAPSFSTEREPSSGVCDDSEKTFNREKTSNSEHTTEQQAKAE